MLVSKYSTVALQASHWFFCLVDVYCAAGCESVTHSSETDNEINKIKREQIDMFVKSFNSVVLFPLSGLKLLQGVYDWLSNRLSLLLML